MPKETLDTLTFFIYVGGYTLGSAIVSAVALCGAKAFAYGIETVSEYYAYRKYIKSQNIEHKKYPYCFPK